MARSSKSPTNPTMQLKEIRDLNRFAQGVIVGLLFVLARPESADVLRARRLVIEDDKKRPRIVLGSVTTQTWEKPYKPTKKDISHPAVTFLREDGSRAIQIAARPGLASDYVEFFDQSGVVRLSMSRSLDGSSISIYGKDERRFARICEDAAGHGIIELGNGQNTAEMLLRCSRSGVGELILDSPSGSAPPFVSLRTSKERGGSVVLRDSARQARPGLEIK